MSASYSVSVRSDDGSEPGFSADLVVHEGMVSVTALSVFPGTGGHRLPLHLVGAELSELLSAMMTALAMPDVPSSSDAAASSMSSSRAAPSRSAKAPSRRAVNRSTGSSAPSDLAKVYWKLGTLAKVASHYSVDKHTARKWINQLGNRTQKLSNRKS